MWAIGPKASIKRQIPQLVYLQSDTALMALRSANANSTFVPSCLEIDFLKFMFAR